MIETQRAEKTLARAWDYVKAEIRATDPGEAQNKEDFLPRLYAAFESAFSRVMREIEAGNLDPFVDLVSTQYGPELEQVRLHPVDRPIRAGFLALAGNPLWWGHLLVALIAQGQLGLDTVVFRVQGQIEYKDVAESNRVPVGQRHEMAKRVLRHFYPLLRYTDLGSEPGNQREGADELYRYMELNQDRRLHMVYLLGAESRERVERYFRQQYEAAQENSLEHNQQHQLTIGWIQRGEYGASLTEDELEKMSVRAQEAVGYSHFLPSALIQAPYIDLGVSSTHYRNTHDSTIVPRAIDEFAQDHGFYGYSTE